MKKYTIIGGSVIICSFIIGSSLLLGQNNKQNSIERQKLWEFSEEQNLRNEIELALDSCLSFAHDNYANQWDVSCEYLGIDKKTDGCLLPAYRADEHNEYHQTLKDNCFKQYK